MARRTVEERRAALAERKAKLDAEIRRLDAREAKKARREDTRRKVLLGACALHMVNTGRWKRDTVLKALDAFLDRDRDRALFDLSLSPKSDASAPAEPPTGETLPQSR